MSDQASASPVNSVFEVHDGLTTARRGNFDPAAAANNHAADAR